MISRRKELTAENEGYTFAQIGRTISEEWKKVEGEVLEKLKVEADRLNIEGIRKLPKEGLESNSDSNSSGADSWSEDEDPSFDETNVKKPIMLRIKREASDRTSRQRKRPSFFQDYENEENNLDKILDEFEQEQIQEARKPREPRPKKDPSAVSKPRKRKAPDQTLLDEEEKEVELETSRSGRVRKIRRRKVFAFDDPDEDESHSDDEDRDEYQPDSEPEEPEEEYIDEVVVEEEEEEDGEGEVDENGIKLPPKKRKGGQMSKEEIEAAKRAAFAAKPHIITDSKKFKGKDYRDEIDSIIKPGEEDNMDFSDDELSQVLKVCCSNFTYICWSPQPHLYHFQMQVKKEQDTEPLVDEVKPMDDSGNVLGGSSEDKLSSAVPEDVSLNTPVSNPEEIAAANEPTTTETSNGTVEASTPSLAEEPPSTSESAVAASVEQAEEAAGTPLTEEEAVSDSKVEPVTEESVNSSLTAKADEGGDLEGSVTEENPPNPYDSDNEVVDDEPVAEEEAADLMSQVPPPPSQTNVNTDDPKVDLTAEQPTPAGVATAADPEEVPMDQSSLIDTEAPPVDDPPAPIDTTSSVSDDKSEVVEPEESSSSRTEIVNGQNSLDSRSVEEDLLTSTTNMEEGDEQYKNIIAESQMDNIFN